ERLAIAVEADSDDFEALVVIELVVPANVRQLAQTGATPGGPEVDQHDLATKVLHVELLAIHLGSGHFDGLSNQRHTASGAFHHDAAAGEFLVAALGQDGADLAVNRGRALWLAAVFMLRGQDLRRANRIG